MTGQSQTVPAPRRPEHGPPRHRPDQPAVGTGERAANFRVSLMRLLRQLHAQRFRLTVGAVLGTISVVLSVVGPKVLGMATDVLLAGVIGSSLPAGLTRQQAIEQAGDSDQAALLRRLDFIPGEGIDFAAVGMILLAVLGLYLVAFLFSLAQGWVFNRAIQLSVYQLRRQVSAKLDRLPLSYFDQHTRGEVLSRITNDIDNVAQTLQQTLTQLFAAVLTLAGVLAMMLWISPLLALVALLSVPVAMVLTGLIGKRSQRLFMANWKATGELNSLVEEAYSGHSVVKVFGRQREAVALFAQRNEELYRSGRAAQFVSGIIMPVMFLVGNLNYVIIAVIGGLRVASGQMNIGDVQAFIHYSRQFTQPLTQVASMANLLQSGTASAERVFELLDAQEMSPEPHQGSDFVLRRGEVVFEDVNFSYTPNTPLITDFQLTVRPGQTVAIVGPTGAGKTTLVNLIMRFYELSGGRILLDGTDIATMPRAVLRRSIAMVLQEAWLFNGTIAENIAYGRSDATQEQILAAAKASFVDRFVRSLPDGYDTLIDEEGDNISAGEKQLITIARAFLADPAMLILDEATSSVDTRTELLLQQAMGALRSGRTSFVIAHRLSTIRDADLILVMANGRIVEQGTHTELLAKDGHYKALYRAQFEQPDGQ